VRSFHWKPVACITLPNCWALAIHRISHWRLFPRPVADVSVASPFSSFSLYSFFELICRWPRFAGRVCDTASHCRPQCAVWIHLRARCQADYLRFAHYWWKSQRERKVLWYDSPVLNSGLIPSGSVLQARWAKSHLWIQHDLVLWQLPVYQFSLDECFVWIKYDFESWFVLFKLSHCLGLQVHGARFTASISLFMDNGDNTKNFWSHGVSCISMWGVK
jgi:hypothetical protein